MPNQERTFEAGGRSYTIRFTQNALYRLEKELGRPLFEALRRIGLVELQTMLWAGLEGARLKRASACSFSENREPAERVKPFTIEQAGDIIDELGGTAVATPIIMDAWRAAMPRNVSSSALADNEEDGTRSATDEGDADARPS